MRTISIKAIALICAISFLTAGNLLASSQVVTNTNDAGMGSLRQAIIDANNNPGPDTIVFNIPNTDPGYQTVAGVSWWRIQPLSALPFLTDNDTIIDGTTQTNNQGDTNPNGPEIEIDGTNDGDYGDGLTITSANNTIKELVINRFYYDGIYIVGSNANNNTIVGNYLGTNVTGTTALANGLDGVYLCSGPQGNTIGGTTPAERNILSGNEWAGLNLGDCSNNKVIGNYIGTDRTGTIALGNDVYGIWAYATQSNTIGGSAPGEPNIIAYNHGPGIIIFGGSFGNTLSRNSFFQNNGLGIEISPPDGVNANDSGDTDTGPNQLLNFPVIDLALHNPATSQTTISGIIDIDTDPTLAKVEVFKADPDPNGYGEGKVYLGTAIPDELGEWSVIVIGISQDDYITAVTIDKDGNTSEFSQNKIVTTQAQPPVITGIDTQPYPCVGFAPLTVTFTVYATTESGQIEAYFWDFDGDGSIDFTSTTNNSATYTYTQSGCYSVWVKVQNSVGLSAEHTLEDGVQVDAPQPPTAVITKPSSPPTIQVGESISLAGLGITGAGGTIVKYEWDLDGRPGFDLGAQTNISPSYTYLEVGTFTVRFRVTETPSGLTGEDTILVTVNPSEVPRVAVVQPGVPRPGKDGLRRTVKGQVTVKAVSVPIPATQTLDLRYRLVGPTLPDKFTSPDDDPPQPQDSAWQTEALAKSHFVTADAGAEGFITKIDTSVLLDNHWYEIIAVANYQPELETYDSWNADQTDKRSFFYVEPSEPELEETPNQVVCRITRNTNNQISKNGRVSVSIPYEGIITDTVLTLNVSDPVMAPGELSLITPYWEITLSGENILLKPAQVSLSYPDTNNDGIVDGTTIPETTLIAYRYDTGEEKWGALPQQTIKPDNNIISVITPAFSIFGMAGLPGVIEEDIGTGSSGTGASRDWHSERERRCGCLGLEVLFLFGLVPLIKRYRSRRKNIRVGR